MMTMRVRGHSGNLNPLASRWTRNREREEREGGKSGGDRVGGVRVYDTTRQPYAEAECEKGNCERESLHVPYPQPI
jgi:hypothetical protein